MANKDTTQLTTQLSSVSHRGAEGTRWDLNRIYWVKPGTCCLSCLGKLIHMVAVSRRKLRPNIHERACHGMVAGGQGTLTVCFSSRRVS